MCAGTLKKTAKASFKPKRPKKYKIGEDVFFIGNGCLVKDKITGVLVETEKGYQVHISDVFRSEDELVEYLKSKVHG